MSKSLAHPIINNHKYQRITLKKGTKEKQRYYQGDAITETSRSQKSEFFFSSKRKGRNKSHLTQFLARENL